MTEQEPLVAALASHNPVEASCKALRQLAYDVLELKQFTMMTFDQERGVAQRIFTDDAAAYPAGGQKPILENAWTETVLKRHQIFVGNTIEELAAVFPDWEKIQSLGLESCVNLPVIVGNKVIGTMNCLNVAGHFTPSRVSAANQLALPAIATFLLATSNVETREQHT